MGREEDRAERRRCRRDVESREREELGSLHSTADRGSRQFTGLFGEIFVSDSDQQSPDSGCEAGEGNV